jgi:hypothetical protein
LGFLLSWLDKNVRFLCAALATFSAVVALDSVEFGSSALRYALADDFS